MGHENMMGRRSQAEGAACAKALWSGCVKHAQGPAGRVGGGEVRKIRVERCWVVVVVGFEQRNMI